MSELSLEEIKKARDQSALIVSKYGKRFLPIFQRLDKAFEDEKSRQELYRKAIAISTQYRTQSSTQNGHQA